MDPLGRKLLGMFGGGGGKQHSDKQIPVNQDVQMIKLPNGQEVAAACPGEIAGLNFGSCLNYFFVRPRPSSSSSLFVWVGRVCVRVLLCCSDNKGTPCAGRRADRQLRARPPGLNR